MLGLMESILDGQFSSSGVIGIKLDCVDTIAGLFGKNPVDEDTQLVRRSVAGDKQAYRRLVERHERRVTTLICHIMSTTPAYRAQYHGDIEDLVQEVFVQAWKSLSGFRGESRFSTWLYRIAVNRALRERKRAKVHSENCVVSPSQNGDNSGYIAGEGRDISAVDPVLSVCDSDRNAQLWAAVDSLPEKQRVVILLRYYDSCSCEDIASIIGCSVGTVWSRLHYGCLKLKQVLSESESSCMVEV